MAANLFSPQHFSSNELLRRVTEIAGFSFGDPVSLLKVLDLAYFLSLEAEEGRTVKVILALAEESERLPAEQWFTTPLTLEFELLRRLTPATDSERTCLRIQSQGDDRPLQIVGITARPLIRDIHPSLARDLALVEVMGPAQVSLQIGDHVVRFNKHKYVVPDGPGKVDTHLIAAIPSAITQHVTTPNSNGTLLHLGNTVLGASKEALVKHRIKLIEETNKVARQMTVDTICELTRLANKLGHGAAFVFTDSSWLLNSMALPSGLVQNANWIIQRKKGGISADPWNCGMLDYVVWRTHFELAQAGIAILKDIPQNVDELNDWANKICHARIRNSLDIWELDTQTCSRLSATDGMVVFGSLLEPRLFGTKVSTDSYLDLPAECKAILDPRGLRHRSAACAVNSLGPAIGIVVSQDGAVMLFVKKEGKPLHCEQVEF